MKKNKILLSKIEDGYDYAILETRIFNLTNNEITLIEDRPYSYLQFNIQTVNFNNH